MWILYPSVHFTVINQHNLWYSPSFFKLLYKFINSNQRIFSYSQICGFFSSIIRHERNRLFDLRNILVANLQNHPFQQVFNVKAFHRKQIKQLLFKQLVFSQLSDLCAYKISKIVPYKDISKLQIPISLKCKISSMCKNKDWSCCKRVLIYS